MAVLPGLLLRHLLPVVAVALVLCRRAEAQALVVGQAHPSSLTQAEAATPIRQYIYPNTAAWTALPRNTNAGITFGAGASIMSQRMADTLDKLAASIQRSDQGLLGSNFRLFVVSAYTAPPTSGAISRSLSHEGRSAEIRLLSGVTATTMGQLAQLAIRAGFAYVEFDSVSRIIVSVLPDACSSRIDLTFLLDSSSSISDPDYVLAKGFIKEVAGYYNVAANQTKVAVVTFSGFEGHKGPLHTCPPGTVYDLNNQGCLCAPGGVCTKTGPQSGVVQQNCQSAADPQGQLIYFYEPGSCPTCQCDPNFKWGGGTEVETNIQLGQYTDPQLLEGAIDALPFHKGFTHTSVGLEHVRQTVFTSSGGARPAGEAIPRVLVVITDGQASPTYEPQQQAGLLHQEGVTVFAIGVGQINVNELLAIASDPDARHLFAVSSFSVIQEFVGRVASLACDSTTMVNPASPIEPSVPGGNLVFFQPSCPTTGNAVTLEVRDLTGTSEVYVSTTNPTPGPLDHEFKDVSSSTTKVIRVPLTSANQRVFIGVLGSAGANTTSFQLEVFEDLFPGLARAYSVASTAPAGTVVLSGIPAPPATTQPGPDLRYSLVAGNDAGLFAINALTGEIRTALPLALAPRVSTLRVRAKDTRLACLNSVLDLDVTVSQPNQSPIALQVLNTLIPENLPAGNRAAFISATDPNFGDTITFTLGGASAALFTVANTACSAQPDDTVVCTANLLSAQPLDFEQAGTLPLTIIATDTSGATGIAMATITVIDQSEAPTSLTLAPAAIPEGAATNDLVGAFVVADPDRSNFFRFRLDDDAGGRFKVVGGSATGALAAARALGPADVGGHTVVVTVVDGQHELNASLAVQVTDLPDVLAFSAAYDTLTVGFLAPDGTGVATLAATLNGAALAVGAGATFSWLGQAGDTLAGALRLDAATGALTVVGSASLTPAGRAFAGTAVVSRGQLSAQAAVRVTVDVPAGPTFGGPYDVKVARNQPVGSQVVHLDANALTPVAFAISSGNELGIFAVDSSTGVVTTLVVPEDVLGPQRRRRRRQLVSLTVTATAAGVASSAPVAVSFFEGCSPFPCLAGFACAPGTPPPTCICDVGTAGPSCEETSTTTPDGSATTTAGTATTAATTEPPAGGGGGAGGDGAGGPAGSQSGKESGVNLTAIIAVVVAVLVLLLIVLFAVWYHRRVDAQKPGGASSGAGAAGKDSMFNNPLYKGAGHSGTGTVGPGGAALVVAPGTGTSGSRRVSAGQTDFAAVASYKKSRPQAGDPGYAEMDPASPLYDSADHAERDDDWTYEAVPRRADVNAVGNPGYQYSTAKDDGPPNSRFDPRAQPSRGILRPHAAPAMAQSSIHSTGGAPLGLVQGIVHPLGVPSGATGGTKKAGENPYDQAVGSESHHSFSNPGYELASGGALAGEPAYDRAATQPRGENPYDTARGGEAVSSAANPGYGRVDGSTSAAMAITKRKPALRAATLTNPGYAVGSAPGPAARTSPYSMASAAESPYDTATMGRVRDDGGYLDVNPNSEGVVYDRAGAGAVAGGRRESPYDTATASQRSRDGGYLDLSGGGGGVVYDRAGPGARAQHESPYDTATSSGRGLDGGYLALDGRGSSASAYDQAGARSHESPYDMAAPLRHGADGGYLAVNNSGHPSEGAYHNATQMHSPYDTAAPLQGGRFAGESPYCLASGPGSSDRDGGYLAVNNSGAAQEPAYDFARSHNRVGGDGGYLAVDTPQESPYDVATSGESSSDPQVRVRSVEHPYDNQGGTTA